METLITYLLKVSISIALFYVLHMLLLRNETFLKLRRIYFIFALLFSLLFPFVNSNWVVSDRSELPLPAFMMSEIEIFIEAQRSTSLVSDFVNGVTTSQILLAIVLLGASFFLIRFLIQLVSLVIKIRMMKAREFNGCEVIAIDNTTIPSFSFFHWIVINTSNRDEYQIQDILCHEEAHVRQLHSIDVLIYEILCIIFCWNPFAWLLKNEMNLNLEYLADEVVQDNKSDLKQYQYTLLQISTANTGVAFINNFNVSHLKKRITMMNKKRSSKVSSGKYLLALPLALALVLGNVAYAAPEIMKSNVASNSMQDTTRATTKTEVYTVVEQMPKFPGGETEMMKFVAQNLHYPMEAQQAGFQGRMTIRFVVSEEGEVVDVERLSVYDKEQSVLDDIIVVANTEDGEKKELELSREDILDKMGEESIRVVKSMPNWEPGMQNGKAVSVYFTLPILFRLK